MYRRFTRNVLIRPYLPMYCIPRYLAVAVMRPRKFYDGRHHVSLLPDFFRSRHKPYEQLNVLMIVEHDSLLKVRLNSYHISQSCLSHLSERLRGSSICSVIAEIAESSTIRTSALSPSASLSPILITGLTRYWQNKLAKTATNSTCENFRPTHSHGPYAQGMKVPLPGSINAISDV